MPRRVLLVRHGESTNNVVMRRLFARRSREALAPREFERAWLRERVTDPDLTETGVREARQLGNWLSRAGVASRRLLVYTSPFKRTLDTTRGILDGLGGSPKARVIVHTYIYETGVV